MVINHVDYNTKYTKLYIRSLAVFLCVALCFCFVLTPPAHAIAITMTTVGIGALVASFLAAVGIDLTFAGYDSSTGSQALEDLLVDYVVGHLGTTLDTWFGNGVIWSNGLLRLAPALASKFEDFVDWFQSEYSVTDNASDVEIFSSIGSLGDIPLYSSLVIRSNVDASNSGNLRVVYEPVDGVFFGLALYNDVPSVCIYTLDSSISTYTIHRYFSNGYDSPQQVSLNGPTSLSGTDFSVYWWYNNWNGYYWADTSDTLYSKCLQRSGVYAPFYGISSSDLVLPTSLVVDTGVIYVPDTGGMTEDEELVIDVVYPGLSAMDWDLASQQIMSQALTGDLTASAAIEDAEVAEIVQTVDPLPNLLGINLPSFSFSLSGIWHYVRTWVSSLGSFMTSLFTVWNGLPYAMVVPVYATAVITIVVGLYRRFFM